MRRRLKAYNGGFEAQNYYKNPIPTDQTTMLKATKLIKITQIIRKTFLSY